MESFSDRAVPHYSIMSPIALLTSIGDADSQHLLKLDTRSLRYPKLQRMFLKYMALISLLSLPFS